MYGNASTTSTTVTGLGFTVNGDVASNSGAHTILIRDINVTGGVVSNGKNITIEYGNVGVVNSILYSDGGSAGNVFIATSTTGSIFASGYNSTVNGGNGGNVTIINSIGNPITSTVNANGGNSTSCGNGGNGGIVIMKNSSYGTVNNNAGLGSNTTCQNINHSSGQQSGATITGAYTPPGSNSGSPSNSSPVSSPASSGGSSNAGTFLNLNTNLGNLNLSNLPKTNLNLGDTSYFGVSKLVNPLADIIKLKPLQNFTDLPKIDFSSSFSNFLNNSLPKSLTELSKTYPSIKNQLNQADIRSGYDLYLMTDSPISIPTIDQTIKENGKRPNDIIFVSVDGKDVPTKISIDQKGNVYQILNVESYSSIEASVKSNAKIVSAYFNNKAIKVTKDKKSIVDTKITAPRGPGKYTLKLVGITLEIHVSVPVIPASSDIPTKQNSAGSAKKSPLQKMWSWFSI